MKKLNLFNISFSIFLFICVFFQCNNLSNNRFEEIKSTLDKIDTDQEIELTLQRIYNEDQKLRMRLKPIMEEYGVKSEEYKNLWADIKESDEENLYKIEYLLTKFGYPKKPIYSNTARKTPILVIHHSENYQIREKYFPMIYQAWKNGHIESFMELFLIRMADLKFQRKSEINIDELIDNELLIEKLIDELNLSRI